jgi:hypothetical protein
MPKKAGRAVNKKKATVPNPPIRPENRARQTPEERAWVESCRGDWVTWRAQHEAGPYKLPQNVLVERAWAAGFWDGEGYAGTDLDYGMDIDLEPASPTLEISIDQAYGHLGLANLERFRKAVGNVGIIRKLGSAKHRWVAKDENEVDRVWATIGPFLGLAKFAQFRRVISVSSMRELRSETFNKKKMRKRPNVLVYEPTSSKQNKS